MSWAITGMVQSKLSLDCNFSAPMLSLLSFMLPLCIICLGMMTWGEYGPSSSSAGANTDQPVCVEAGDNAESNGAISDKASSPPKPFSFFGLIPLQTSLRMFAAIAIVDVYASYFTILAFKYTTITSVVLFDALAIHSAMVVSRCFFKRRYTRGHFLGVIVCTIGMIINVAVDYEEDKDGRSFFVGKDNAQQQLIQEEYPHKIRGDILAILGGILFGIANTLQEVTVKEGSVVEYLGCFTFFASIITFTQAMIFERAQIIDFFSQTPTDTCAESEGENLFLLFAIAGCVKYVGNGFFLQISDATFFNLSMLTGDAWAVIFSVYGEGISPPPTFYVALVITLSGVIIYETAPSPVGHTPKETKRETEMTRDSHLSDDDEHMIT
ncbi:hypothetical protein ACHAXA_006313 [Cyclostephanos tholiformis]|uniref:Uncharacterized protein n=1 Tax=Cyclostephanos tholiformis TaxID=382380 RepID=A0ABD3R5E2_9STRA